LPKKGTHFSCPDSRATSTKFHNGVIEYRHGRCTELLRAGLGGLRAVRPAFLPSQVPRSDPECGERKLLFAVLADAFDDLRRAPRRSDATLAWFSCPDSGVLTLAAICDALGFTLAGVQTAAFKLHRLAHPPRH
jgi:hypothetical protein